MCRCGLLVVLRRKISYVFSSLDTNGRFGICDFEGLIAMAALVLRARAAKSAFVGRAAAFAASLPSRAVASVVALRFERAFAVGALVV
jgi:hypothetical protein